MRRHFEAGGDRTSCPHSDVRCVNPYELVRKYECASCGGVVMCACEQDFGERFLPHQLSLGTDLETGQDVAVTLGFQPGTCNTCRGKPEEAHPIAEQYRRTSKIVRYYWREIYFQTTERFAVWAEEHDYSDIQEAARNHPDERSRIEREVIEEVKQRHAVSPKYQYQERSQAEVISKYNVDVLDLEGEYVTIAEGSARIRRENELLTAEEFASLHFQDQGYKVLVTESVPFHVLFAIYLWLLVQDHDDPQLQFVMFGHRTAYERGEQDVIRTFLPNDFGKPGYAHRRAEAIADHFELLNDDLEWLFEYWLEPSSALRQYLWAHRNEDVETARQIISIVPHDQLIRIFRYLIAEYWHRFLGWPDLLVYNANEYFFVEVKGSGDKLREDQKSWIQGNAEYLHLPFKLAKIHRRGERPTRFPAA